MSNDLLIDKRIIERNMKKGRLDAAEYRSMLDALPDLHGKLWQRHEARVQVQEREAAPAPVPPQATTSVPPPPAAAAAYAPAAPSEAPAAEPASPLPSTNQPSPFG